jgi:hypothetical protein
LDLTRPSEDERAKNLMETKKELGMKIAKKSDPAFLSQSALKKQEGDTFVRYTPTTTNTANPGM